MSQGLPPGLQVGPMRPGHWPAVRRIHEAGIHRAAGFRRVGVSERLGRDRTGRWRDVVLMERPNDVVGIG